MNITKNTTTLTCPHCKNTTTYEFGFRELTDGRKLVCGKCGRQIVIDRDIFEKAEGILEHLPTSNLFNMTTVTKSSMSFTCPQCGKTTTTDMTIGRLVDGERVFCSHCGSEIPMDGSKIRQADAALRGLAALPECDQNGTLNTPEGPVVVTRKTFNIDVKTNFDTGKSAGPGTGGSAGGSTPILTPRRAIEPKKGCLGAMVMLVLMGAAILISLL